MEGIEQGRHRMPFSGDILVVPWPVNFFCVLSVSAPFCGERYRSLRHSCDATFEALSDSGAAYRHSHTRAHEWYQSSATLLTSKVLQPAIVSKRRIALKDVAKVPFTLARKVRSFDIPLFPAASPAFARNPHGLGNLTKQGDSGD